MKDDKAAAEKMNKVLVKKVRPWVKFSLSLSAILMSYACARQTGLLHDRQTVVQFDLQAIEDEASGN